MTSVGDRLGCVTVLEVMEAAQAIERDLRGYRGKPAHHAAKGAHVWVRCDCLLEFLVRARELSRRKSGTKCGEKCELGREEKAGRFLGEWTHCRNPLCGRKLRKDNATGFCTYCVHNYPGRRWFLLSNPARLRRWQAQKRAWSNCHRAKRIAAGLCRQCGEPSAEDRSLCARHLASAVKCQQAHRAKKKQAEARRAAA